MGFACSIAFAGGLLLWSRWLLLGAGGLLLLARGLLLLARWLLLLTGRLLLLAWWLLLRARTVLEGRCSACAAGSGGQGCCNGSLRDAVCTGTASSRAVRGTTGGGRIASQACASLEFPSQALRDQRHIGVTIRPQAEGVRGIEGAGGPAHPAEIDIRVLVEEVERLADIRQAGRRGGPTAELGDESLSLVGLEEGDERLEAIGNLVGGALGVGAGPVRVEVVVHVEDELRGRAVAVFDAVERRC